jgi:hypothetical protein
VRLLSLIDQPPIRVRQHKTVLWVVEVNVGDPVTQGTAKVHHPALLGEPFRHLGKP